MRDDPPAPGIQRHDDLLATELLQQPGKKRWIIDRRGPDHGLSGSGVKCGRDRFHRPQTSAQVPDDVPAARDVPEDLQVQRIAPERPVEIHHVDPPGPLAHPFVRHCHWIDRILRRRVIAPLEKPNAPASLEVDGRDDLHHLPPPLTKRLRSSSPAVCDFSGWNW